MIKIYQQFYSMMNDPILKATYESQLLKTTGDLSLNANKKTFKQRLEMLKTLPHAQTK